MLQIQPSPGNEQGLRLLLPAGITRWAREYSLNGGGKVEVRFVTSVAPIVRDVDAARSSTGRLGLSFEGEGGD